MDKKTRNTIKLGMFVTLGTIIFIGTIYFLGSQRNIFGSTTRVYTVFKNVSGLRAGNNVRFSGINVGTVSSLEIISDSTVRVVLVLENDAAEFIRKDATASIGSEGLMGDKIISLSSGSSTAPTIDDGDRINGIEPVEMEQVLSALNETGQDAQQLIANLASLSETIRNGEGMVGHLITDTTLTNRFEQMITSLQRTSTNAASVTNDIAAMSHKVRRGEGTLGMLLKEDSIAVGFAGLLDTLQRTAAKSQQITTNLADFTEKLNKQNSTVDKLLTDTTMAQNLEETIESVNQGAENLNRTTEKVNNSWFFNFLFGGKKKKKDE